MRKKKKKKKKKIKNFDDQVQFNFFNPIITITCTYLITSLNMSISHQRIHSNGNI
jgi:hypothetical protein